MRQKLFINLINLDHRTECNSKFEENNYTFIGDIIINPRGDILDDWNEYGNILDLEAYRNRLVINNV